MAVIGDAYVVVHAITKGFEAEVRRGVSGIDLGKEANAAGNSFSRGFGRGFGSKLTDNLSAFDKAALAARLSFQKLVRTGYTLGPLLSVLVSSIGTVVSALFSLASSLVAAAPSAIVFASALTSIGVVAIGLVGALSGVGKAISAGTKASLAGKKSTDEVEQAQRRLALVTERVVKAQEDFTKAVREAREEIQQLGFEAEDAALSEKRAAIELEKAREALARTQDLPPNSRARREAQLAFAEAELNLRKLKDRSRDLAEEQDRLAKSAAKEGTEQYKQTETYKNARKGVIDSLIDQKEAEDALKKAQSGGSADTSFQDALAGLSKEAQKFVKYMVGTFIPALKTLRNALGKELFSQLEDGLEELRTKLFPSLRPVLVQLGNDIGSAFTKITDAITKLENIKKLNSVIKQSGDSIKSYATSLGNVYEGFLTLLVAAEPLIKKFNKFIEDKTSAFKDYLNTQEASGELTKFFNKSGDIAGRLSAIFGNTFSTIGNLTKANFAPGGGGYILIDWLKDVTARWEKFSGTVTGQQKLQKYFKDVAENAKLGVGAVGAYVKEIAKAGADPNVGKFFKILEEGAPSVGNLTTELNKGAPALARFVVQLERFAAITATGGAISTFFTTLEIGLRAVNRVLEIPAVKTAFDFLSTVLGVTLAVGVAYRALGFALKVAAGNILVLVRGFGILIGSQKLATMTTATLTASMKTFATTVITNALRGVKLLAIAIGKELVKAFAGLGIAMRANPLGVLLTVIGLVLAGIGILYTKSETFRNIVDGIGRAIKDGIGTAITFLKENWTTILAVLTGPIGLAVLYISRNWENITTGIRNFVTGAKKALTGIWSGLIDGLKTAWTNAKTWWNVNVASKKLKIGGAVVFGKTLPSFTLGFPELAKGGVIQPSPGGTIARIGEAGRAERVEPLDPDGLSQRDKAMIQLLSGGQGAGMTINVYPSPGMNESELASMVSRQIAFQLRRGGA